MFIRVMAPEKMVLANGHSQFHFYHRIHSNVYQIWDLGPPINFSEPFIQSRVGNTPSRRVCVHVGV